MTVSVIIDMARFAGPVNMPAKPRNLLAACLIHALHDGYTDSFYAFLPIWQTQFSLSYAALAGVRALYSGLMGGLQIPGERLLRSTSSRTALAVSTLIAATGFLIMLLPLGFSGLCVGLVVAGIGSSIQHPRGSFLVTETYGSASRGPLGLYNFSGDVGKAVLPALVALFLPVLAWRSLAGLLASFGLIVTVCLLALIRKNPPSKASPNKTAPVRGRGGFRLLAAIGGLDTATRTGYLIFLPFLIQGRGGTSPTIGMGLALLFVGGALGKASCTWLGARLGVIGCVLVTETSTALLIVATLFTPLVPMLVLLPLLGMMLNGTSSVLYGTVPELAPNGDVRRAFAIFYTSAIGSGGVAPILFGAIADYSGKTIGIVAAAATAALIVPLVLALRPYLRSLPPASAEATSS